jgi:hypothetical protein
MKGLPSATVQETCIAVAFVSDIQTKKEIPDETRYLPLRKAVAANDMRGGRDVCGPTDGWLAGRHAAAAHSQRRIQRFFPGRRGAG